MNRQNSRAQRFFAAHSGRYTNFGNYSCRLIVIVALSLTTLACQAQDQSSSGKEKPPQEGEEVYLTLLGYNYTDHGISDYEVNGAWGGDVRLSTATAGGSKGTCCVRWRVGQELPVTVNVRWVSDVCLWTKRVSGQNFTNTKIKWSEKEVQVTEPPQGIPHYFQTHFYPDGRIEVAVADDYTPPRLKLPVTEKNQRPGADPWPRCTETQLKEWQDG
ncbi:DUF3304 domain-containing protein [Salinisphaera sp. C84B14]|uniref:DUF3304 domain-containing protein n=1 Tax=Salinisphaera sp. C84B14 TaxID=1304155 RepID=UPI00333F5E6D